jgi:hypothetical protein
MILVFVTPIQDPPKVFFDHLPARAVIHGILFLGFTHSSIKAMKKQLSVEKVRKNAFLYVLIASTVIMLASETFMIMGGVKSAFCPWHMSFDMLGTFLGIGSFKLLYHNCY